MKWACVLWILIGGYLFTALPGAELYSWPALAYFTLGLGGAGLVFGGGTWIMGFVLAAASTFISFDAGRRRGWIITIGILLAMTEAYVMFRTAHFVVSSII